jgi:membrane-bound ClpP family serine protease
MRRPRELEIVGLALFLIGIGSCIIAVEFGVPGVLTGGLVCIAGIIVYVLG